MFAVKLVGIKRSSVNHNSACSKVLTCTNAIQRTRQAIY